MDLIVCTCSERRDAALRTTNLSRNVSHVLGTGLDSLLLEEGTRQGLLMLDMLLMHNQAQSQFCYNRTEELSATVKYCGCFIVNVTLFRAALIYNLLGK